MKSNIKLLSNIRLKQHYVSDLFSWANSTVWLLMTYNPVCGADEEVYFNACFAECEAVDYTRGICPSITEATVLYLGTISENGCGWVLETDNRVGEHIIFLEVALPEEYKEIGLKIAITYFPNDVAIECTYQDQIYFVIIDNELVSIRKL